MRVLHVIAKRKYKRVSINVSKRYEKKKKETHLNAENFILSHSARFLPPLSLASKQIGHKPALSLPTPLTKRGVYKSSTVRGELKCPPPGGGAGCVYLIKCIHSQQRSKESLS